MKKNLLIGMAAALLSLPALGEEQREQEIKLDGFYCGAGVHVNQDHGTIKADEGGACRIQGVPVFTWNKGDRIGKSTDLNYGIHGIIGYGHLFQNNLYLAAEAQIGYNHHPVKTKILNFEKTTPQLFKGGEVFLLSRVGYKFCSVPGIIYLSAGGQGFKIDANDDRVFIRPVLGLGYQHGLSEHWSLRGDLLYTHVGEIKFKERIGDRETMLKGKGRLWSARLTFCYTL
jgi:hypothetical protein